MNLSLNLVLRKHFTFKEVGSKKEEFSLKSVCALFHYLSWVSTTFSRKLLFSTAALMTLLASCTSPDLKITESESGINISHYGISRLEGLKGTIHAGKDATIDVVATAIKKWVRECFFNPKKSGPNRSEYIFRLLF